MTSLSLTAIDTLTKLAQVLPKLVELHEKLDGKWDPHLDKNEFLDELVKNFNDNCWYFGELDEKGDLIYFASIQRWKPDTAFFWLLYVNVSHRDKTKVYVQLLKEFMRNQGFKKCFLATSRMTSSYERWLNKQGAFRFSQTYKLDL